MGIRFIILNLLMRKINVLSVFFRALRISSCWNLEIYWWLMGKKIEKPWKNGDSFVIKC